MSIDVDVEFVGCFDTVASVGAIIPRVLPFSTHNGKTRVFRHALALDEYRVKFRQETWHYSLPEKPWSLQDFVVDTITAPMKLVSNWLQSEEARGTAEFYKILTEAVKGNHSNILGFTLTNNWRFPEEAAATDRPVDINEVIIS